MISSRGGCERASGSASERSWSSAGLIVVGLSERWRREGLGETRSQIARDADAPTLFVRRGVRPGALAPRGDVTRFSWSSPGVPVGRMPADSGDEQPAPDLPPRKPSRPVG